MRTYILVYQAADINHVAIVKRWLETQNKTIEIHTPLPLVHLIKTELISSELQLALDFLFPQGNYLVSEINPRNSDGRLEASDWAWINGDTSRAQSISNLPLSYRASSN